MSTEVVRGLSNAEYRAAEGISKSDLDLIGKSPLHYYHAKQSPSESTPAMKFGSAFHAYLLEPDTFHSRYIIAPDINRKTNKGREEYESFLEFHKDKEIISTEDLEKIKAMCASVMAHNSASKLLKKGEAEVSFFFDTPIEKIRGKCRPDWITTSNILVDVKTTQDASREAFSKAIANYSYYKQAAYYLDGTKEITGNDKNFVFIVVEKEPPYAVACYLIEDRAIEFGRSEYLKNLITYQESLSSQNWNGYSPLIEEIFMPEWAYR